MKFSEHPLFDTPASKHALAPTITRQDRKFRPGLLWTLVILAFLAGAFEAARLNTNFAPEPFDSPFGSGESFEKPL